MSPDSQPRATEVTIGEVYRLALRIDQRLDQITKDMVGRQEYESDQEGIERRLSEISQGLADERVERQRGDESIVSKAEAAKRWAITTALAAAVFLLGFIGFILDLGGGPT